MVLDGHRCVSWWLTEVLVDLVVSGGSWWFPMVLVFPGSPGDLWWSLVVPDSPGVSR
jgi:hypothetical protein